MKKGMVVKTNSRYALVLSEDSVIEKINLKPNVTEGQEIYYFEEDIYKAKQNSTLKISALVASLLIIALITTFINSGNINNVYANPYAVVTVDINPSVEIFIDADSRVTKVVPLNDDAKSIISNDLINMTLEEVLEIILDRAAAEGYLVENGTILISSFVLEISDKDTDDDEDENDDENEDENDDDEDSEENDNENVDDEDTDEVEDTIKSFIEKKTEQYEFLYAKGSDEAYKASKSEGLSLGKYQMLMFLDDSITKEEIKDMKVSEIAERKQNRELEKATKKEGQKDDVDGDKVVVDDLADPDEEINDEESTDDSETNINQNKNKEKSKNDTKNVPTSSPLKEQTKEKTTTNTDNTENSILDDNTNKTNNTNNSNNGKSTKDNNKTIETNETPKPTVEPTEIEQEKNKEKNKETNNETNNETNQNNNSTRNNKQN